MCITYIPGIHWTQPSCEEKFLEVANRLVKEGMDEEEVLEIMQDLFYAVAGEYEE